MKKPQHKPFFSIVIPTYNRARDVRRAIVAILQQNFRDFEVVVSDNYSSDNTKDIVKSYKDKRIIYRCNDTNIGWIPNMTQALRVVRGAYILLHGDDDMMIHKDFLARLHIVLQKHTYGFIRVNYLSYSEENHIIFDFHNRQFVGKELPFHSSSDQIVNFFESVDPFFMTGIVIQKNIVKETALLESEFAPWFPAAYRAMEKYGGLLWPEYEFIATWSKNAAYPRYFLENDKFQFERYFEEVKKVVSKYFFTKFLNKRLRILISEFPAGKFFTSNANFFRYALHLLDVDPSFRFSIRYWFWFVFSILTPRSVLFFLRKRMVESRKDETIPNLNAYYRKIAVFGNLTSKSV